MSIQQLLLGASGISGGAGVSLSITPSATLGGTPHTGNHTVGVTGGTPTAYSWTFDGWVSGGDDGSYTINSGATTATVNVTVETSAVSKARFRVDVTVDGIVYTATCTRQAVV